MLPCYQIARIDDRAQRHNLGTVSAYAVRRNGEHQPNGSGRLVVMGHLYQTPPSEQPALTRASTELAPLDLEISNGEITHRGAFKVMRFDPISMLTILWSTGPVETEEQATPATSVFQTIAAPI